MRRKVCAGTVQCMRSKQEHCLATNAVQCCVYVTCVRRHARPKRKVQTPQGVQAPHGIHSRTMMCKTCTRLHNNPRPCDLESLQAAGSGALVVGLPVVLQVGVLDGAVAHDGRRLVQLGRRELDERPPLLLVLFVVAHDGLAAAIPGLVQQLHEPHRLPRRAPPVCQGRCCRSACGSTCACGLAPGRPGSAHAKQPPAAAQALLSKPDHPASRFMSQAQGLLMIRTSATAGCHDERTALLVGCSDATLPDVHGTSTCTAHGAGAHRRWAARTPRPRRACGCACRPCRARGRSRQSRRAAARPPRAAGCRPSAPRQRPACARPLAPWDASTGQGSDVLLWYHGRAPAGDEHH